VSVIRLVVEGAELRAELSSAVDLSIPLAFDGPQPEFFGAPRASSTPLAVGEWIGDTSRGSGCNVAVHQLVPHCNGTHTECVGHIVDDACHVSDLALEALMPATLVTVAATEHGEIDRGTIEAALETFPRRGLRRGLILRTTPNDETKRARAYTADDAPPFLGVDAAGLLVELGVQHVLVDFPSLDPMNDGGRLSAHHAYWGLPQGSRDGSLATRASCTVTELIYVPDEVRDGYYLLNLQVPPFRADAAPSRPVIYELQ